MDVIDLAFRYGRHVEKVEQLGRELKELNESFNVDKCETETEGAIRAERDNPMRKVQRIIRPEFRSPAKAEIYND